VLQRSPCPYINQQMDPGNKGREKDEMRGKKARMHSPVYAKDAQSYYHFI